VFKLVRKEVVSRSACQLPGGRRWAYLISQHGWFSSVLCVTDSVIIGGYQVVGGRSKLSLSEPGCVGDEVDSLSVCQLPIGRRRTYLIAYLARISEIRFA
jgi:hypothetical protein